MPLVSVPAVWNGKDIRLLEDAPVEGSYRVLVTFVEPTSGKQPPGDRSRFRDSFGAWQDDRPIEATLRDVHEARLSRGEAPAL